MAVGQEIVIEPPLTVTVLLGSGAGVQTALKALNSAALG